MKKLLILGSVLFGFGVTGLLAEDATVSLPAPAAPGPAATPAASAPASAQGTTHAAGKKHHKKHHKKRATEAATPDAPAPKS